MMPRGDLCEAPRARRAPLVARRPRVGKKLIARSPHEWHRRVTTDNFARLLEDHENVGHHPGAGGRDHELSERLSQVRSARWIIRSAEWRADARGCLGPGSMAPADHRGGSGRLTG